MWETGIDLEFQQEEEDNKNKKKNLWLSASEFENINPSSQNDSINFAAGVSDVPSDEPQEPLDRSFAEVASIASDGWSPMEENKRARSIQVTSAQPVAYPPNAWNFIPNGQNMQKTTSSAKHHPPTPSTPRRQSKMYMSVPIAGPRYPLPPGAPLPHMPISPHFNADYDNEIYSFLYSVDQKLSSISSFYERLDSILRESMRLTHRTLGMLIRTLTHVISFERTDATKYNARGRARLFASERLRYHLDVVVHAISRYLHTNVLTPLEFLPILDFFAVFLDMHPDFISRIPISLTQECFQRIKPTFHDDQIQQVFQQFKDIGALVSPDAIHWPKDDRPLPVDFYHTSEYDTNWSPYITHDRRSADALHSNTLPLLRAIDIFSEAIETDESSTFEYHRFAHNQVRQSHKDIYSYLTMHYNLLREQLHGPAVTSLRDYVMYGARNVEKSEEGWSTYTRLQPLFTTLTLTFSKPAIVLEAQLDDVASVLPPESSWCILIPEYADHKQSRSSDERVGLLAKRASIISGTIAYAGIHLFNRRALSSNTALFVFVPDDVKVDRFDFHATYTSHAIHKNAAATLPTLNWLHQRISKHEAEDCSPAIVPFLIAPNSNTRSELTKDDETINHVPNYLQGVELDISPILAHGVRKTIARLGQTQEDCIWPQHIPQHLSLPPAQRPPLYALSPSQTKAVQHAISKPVTFISGKEGTGKSYLASKLVELLHQTLTTTQCYHPVLVITKRETTLDHILRSVIKDIPDVARLAANSDSDMLRERDICKLAVPLSTDPTRKQWHSLEKKYATLQTQLNALWNYRWRVLNDDPVIMASTIPPTYEDVFRFGYPHASLQQSNDISIQKLWLDWIAPVVSENGSVAAASSDRTLPENIGTIQRALSNSLQKKTGKAMLPLTTHQFYEDRQHWTYRHLPSIPPVFSVDKWPFPTSKDAYRLQDALRTTWFEFTSDVIWTLPNQLRKKLHQRIKSCLLKHIDNEIGPLISEQTTIAESLDDIRRQKWTSVSRYNRVIGVTAHIAAANQELLNALGARVILIEEAEDISESMIVPLLLQSRAEQLIVFGKSYSTSRPQFRDPEAAGNQEVLEVSLFERWRLAGGEVLHLDEQWRLCSEIAGIHASVAGSAADQRLLITSPMSSENYANQSAPAMLSVDQRAFFIDCQTDAGEGSVDTQLSNVVKSEVKLADADEARMVCHLALYFCQQGYKASRITILTIDTLQQSILQTIMKSHIPKFSHFSGDVHSVKIDLVENYHDKENMIVVLWLGSPSAALMSDAFISLAVSRGRFGLFMVGASATLRHTRWYNVLQHMENRGNVPCMIVDTLFIDMTILGLLAHQITLTCQKHKDQATLIGKWTDFRKVKNGGCSVIRQFESFKLVANLDPSGEM